MCVTFFNREKKLTKKQRKNLKQVTIIKHNRNK